MARRHGTKRDGGAWTEKELDAIWLKGAPVPGKDPAKVRADWCGAWMERGKHGDTTTNGFGWEVDHVVAVANGGSDALSNLQPMQWQNNRKKGDSDTKACAVVAG